MQTISKKQQESDERLMCFVLRHRPQALKLTLSSFGWCNIIEFVNAMKLANGSHFTLSHLKHIVAVDGKMRFSFDKNMSRIRANQGHSVDIDLELTPIAPPTELWHGTAQKYIDSIFAQGVSSKKRHHVHLSVSIEAAIEVGSRHGKPVVLKLDVDRMNKDGLAFYQSENGIWLTDAVPSQYLERIALT